MPDDELTPPADDAPDDQPDKDWQAEASKWKALARKHEQAAKDNADAARRLAEIEESGKTEQEHLAEARCRADISMGASTVFDGQAIALDSGRCTVAAHRKRPAIRSGPPLRGTTPHSARSPVRGRCPRSRDRPGAPASWAASDLAH